MTGRPDTSTRWSGVPGFILSRRFITLWSIVVGLYAFGWATGWTFDPEAIGTFWPGRFFSAQADAMLHGRLWVPPSSLPGECFVSGGECYGYFGIVPSLVRLPLVLVLGVEHSEMTPLFVAIGIGVALWVALDLCRRVLLRERAEGSALEASWLAVAAVVLGPGSVLMLVTDPYVYQEAILWSVVGTLVGVDLFWRWWTDGRPRQFVGAVIALVLAAGSRPTAALVGLVLAIGLVIFRFIVGRLTRRAIIGAIALAVLPIAFVVAVFFAKFGRLLPPDESYQGRDFTYIQNVIAVNGGELSNGLKFVPTGLWAALRPDALRFLPDRPWVDFRFGRTFGQKPLESITYLPPLSPGSMNVEPSMSLTDVMPLAIVATIGGVVMIIVRRRNLHELLILAALCTPPFLTLTAWTIATRYLGDFYPLVAVGTAFGATLLGPFRRLGVVGRSVIGVPVLLLTVVSAPIAGALAWHYDWIYRFGID